MNHLLWFRSKKQCIYIIQYTVALTSFLSRITTYSPVLLKSICGYYMYLMIFFFKKGREVLFEKEKISLKISTKNFGFVKCDHYYYIHKFFYQKSLIPTFHKLFTTNKLCEFHNTHTHDYKMLFCTEYQVLNPVFKVF